jgi:3-dehydroquinate synthetase
LKGGGLLLDVGGFACAIYMREISNVTYIPTTLLAMVDATVGGKTGINFGAAKNIIGTIRHPNHIIIDIKTLESLSEREFYNGMAEAIKMAVTYDA